MLTKTTYFRILSFMVIITIFLPVISNNLPMGLGSFRYFWAPLWLASLLLFKGKLFSNKIIIRFLFYGLSVAILIPTAWYNMDSWLKEALYEEFYWMVTIVSIFIYFILSRDHTGLIFIIKWALIFIGITALISILASFINPAYSRNFTGSSFNYLKTAEGMLIYRLGAGTYSFGQGIICLLPLLIYLYKLEYKVIFSKRMLLIYIAILFIVLVRMQFFANILLGFIVIVTSFLGSKRIKLSVFTVLMMLLILVIIPKEFLAGFLYESSNTFAEDTENYNKMMDMAGFFSDSENKSSGTGQRLSRYPMLFNAFSNHPFFGNAHSQTPLNIESGYHLHWMGKLGATGIIGVLLFFYPHVYLLKSWLRRFNKRYSYFVLISVLAFFSLGLMKTIAGRDIWATYFLLIPGIYYLSIFNPIKQKKGSGIRNN